MKSDPHLSLSNVYINKNLSKEDSFTNTIDNTSDISIKNNDSENVSDISKKNNDAENVSDISMKNNDVKNVSDILMKNNDVENISYDTDFKESLNESNDKSNDIWNICENWRGLINSTNIKNESSQECDYFWR